MDVVRAAISEIEQYGRVLLEIEPGIVVSGQAAADVVHLLAEIIENATKFPRGYPGTRLRAAGVHRRRDARGHGPGDRHHSVPPDRHELAAREPAAHRRVRVPAHGAVRGVPAGRAVRSADPAATGNSAGPVRPDLAARHARTPGKRPRCGRAVTASSRAPARLLTAGRRPAGRDGIGQPATGRGGSGWFRAQRSSERHARGTSPSTSVLAAAGRAPAAGQGEPATPAWQAFGTPAASTAAPSIPAPSIAADGLLASGPPARQAPAPPVAAGRTTAGLPVRRPGANLFSGSACDTQASDSVRTEDQAAGSSPGAEKTGQALAPRTAPDPVTRKSTQPPQRVPARQP